MPETDAGQAPKTANFTAADLQKGRDLIGQSEDLSRKLLAEYRSYLDGISDDTEKAFKLNEQSASFFQKLAMLDGAIIALSLSLIGSLLSYTTEHRLPRRPFLWLVCPAWGMLLISMCACGLIILQYYGTNRAMRRLHSAAIAEYHLLSMWWHGERLASCLTPVTSILGVPGGAALTTNMAELQKMREKASDDSQAALKATTTALDESRTGQKVFMRIALLCMMLGILLLCIFAVKTLLTVSV